MNNQAFYASWRKKKKEKTGCLYASKRSHSPTIKPANIINQRRVCHNETIKGKQRKSEAIHQPQHSVIKEKHPSKILPNQLRSTVWAGENTASNADIH